MGRQTDLVWYKVMMICGQIKLVHENMTELSSTITSSLISIEQ